MLDSRLLTRTEIERHSIDMRQFIDFRQSTMPNGIRIIEAYNSSGLTFTILPDRGMDVWMASYNGVPLTWISQGSPHMPDFGTGWLRQFNGGLLTTCGLMHVGPPEHDERSGEFRDIHGQFSRLQAGAISIDRHWYGESDYSIWLNGEVAETRLFGEQLVLKRSYGLELGEPTITIWDTITNFGDEPVPLMLLYHFNLGYPLVREGTRLHTPSATVVPRDAAAKPGLSRWWEYKAAAPQYAEQVFFHQLRTKSNGFTKIMLGNESLALTLDWDTASLPYFTQWKNTRQGIYVSGIEPGNCVPEGLNAARHNGRLVMLEPAQEYRSAISLSVLEGKEQMRECWVNINQLQDMGAPVEACHLNDFPK
ncbi:MAG: aldose 1-epimerase family protein [Anaerolineae bacterium]